MLGRLGLDVRRTRWPGPRWPGGPARRAASSTRVTGCWASQSISRPGCSARSSLAIATSRRAWPRPIGEEMYSARLRRERPRRQRGGGPGGQAKSRMTRLAATGSRRCGRVARALERDQPGARDGRGHGRPRGHGPTIASAEPCRTRVGQRTWAQSRSAVSRSLSQSASMPRTMVSGSVSRPQPIASSICLVECGSVNICSEEEVQESRPVAQPVVAVPLGPAGQRLRFLVERVRALLLGGVRGQQQVGRDQHQAADPLRVLGSQEQVIPGAAPGHDDRLVHAHVIQHRAGVVGGGAPVVGAHLAGAGPSARSRAGRT